MPGNSNKPLLLVDVDGVISLFGFDLDNRPEGRWTMVDGIAHLLSLGAGDHLRSLAPAFELVWCTGWEERANEYLPHALKLTGPIPYIAFDGRARSAAHWKLAAIDDHAGPDRPLAWIDDAHDEACAAWAAARQGPTLLVATEPAVGMTGEHVARLLTWARRNDGGGAPAQLPSAPPHNRREALHMGLDDLVDKAKDAIEDRGGNDALKEDLGELKDIASGEGSLGDKAKDAFEALKDPGAEGD